MPVYMHQARIRYLQVLFSAADEARGLPAELMMRKAGLSRGMWEVLRNYTFEPVSLEAPNRDEWVKLTDLLPDRKTPLPSEVAIQRELSEKLKNTLRKLSSKQERVIKQRFGIDYSRSYTLQEIGGQLGLSKERVRQIEKKALERLKKPKFRNELERLLELCE